MFLAGLSSRPVSVTDSLGGSAQLFLGRGAPPLEVVVVLSPRQPRRNEVFDCWKVRRGNRAAPVLLVVIYGNKGWVCGPTGLKPPVYEGVELGQLERICRSALVSPSQHAAVRLLNSVLSQAESAVPGIINRGLLSDHVLEKVLPGDGRWQQDCEKARPLLSKADEELLQALGFQLRRFDRLTTLLETDRGQLAVAVLLCPEESPDQNLSRFNGLSPVSYAINVAQHHNVRFVVMVQQRTLRLYPAEIGLGVGQRGRTETFIELHLDLLRDDQAGFLWHLFSAEALVRDGLLDKLLDNSKRFAGDLAKQFRERIYNEVVPRLAQGVAGALHGKRRASQPDLAQTYELALTILFRLLFIAYGEDKDLLPYEWNDAYRKRSLKSLAQELAEKVNTAGGLGCVDAIPWDTQNDALWEQVHRLFRSVEQGYKDWGVPVYDGRLFSSDPAVSPLGARIEGLKLTDAVMGPVLCHLLLTGTSEGAGPVDFRSLSVREFGTIYEGLLESELSYAEQDLVVDENTGQYRPLTPKEMKRNRQPDVKMGTIYLHNRSGARKSTGSYYTKSFAVEHLLDEALQPALERHIACLRQLDEESAAKSFFDFYVADIAMGSGHFLVAAVDRIERALSSFLADRPLPGVQQQLATLRQAALNELDQVELAEVLGPRIEDNQLLRRLIARRCIFGVDLNPLAVDLARLSIWIHTFVPGLPLSFLEHHLVCGNSLTGVGTFQEIQDVLGERTLLIDPKKILDEACGPLDRLARLTDATPKDLQQARQAYQQARDAVRPVEALCDLVAAARLEPELAGKLNVDLHYWDEIKGTLYDSSLHRKARKVLEHLRPLHFPVAFPEVFLRNRTGFDVILGNPPWEKARVEEHAFWARYEPGLRGLSQREQEQRKEALRCSRDDLLKQYNQELAEAEAIRRALVAGPYPGMGTGDPDVYKAFCWRFWHLVAEDGGQIGVVLPRSAWAAKGCEEFRKAAFQRASRVSLTFLLNRDGWVFDDAEPRYTVALSALGRAGRKQPILAPARVILRGPFASREHFDEGRTRPPAEFDAQEVLGWTESAAVPLFPTETSVEIFRQMRRHPRLDLDDGNTWRARPTTELHATNDKRLMDLQSETCPPGYWPVYKGESFDLWEPDRGPEHYYAWGNPKDVLKHLYEKRLRAGRNAKSPFSEFPPKWLKNQNTLPCLSPRIAFRDVTRSTDSRTIRAALIPGGVFVNHTAPYLLWSRGDVKDCAYLLGILSSLVLDWHGRKVVETHLTFFVLNALPIPRPERADHRWQRVVELAARLAAVDERFAEWATAVGVSYGALEETARFEMICELDAVVAHLYGLEEGHLRHIFETFHEGWGPGTRAGHPTLGDYDRRLATTLEFFQKWQ